VVSSRSYDAGDRASAFASDRRSRETLRALRLTSASEYTRRRVARALAHEPCPRGFVFVEWFGVEGQDYSKCELPPDYR
jgi:hypothetical protein